MYPGKYNLKVIKGDAITRVFTIYDGSPTGNIVTLQSARANIAAGILVPRNLTGSTIEAKMSDGKTTVVLTAAIVNAAGGVVSIFYAGTQTSSIAWSKGTWYLRMIYPGVIPKVEIEGTVNVTKA